MQYSGTRGGSAVSGGAGHAGARSGGGGAASASAVAAPAAAGAAPSSTTTARASPTTLFVRGSSTGAASSGGSSSALGHDGGVYRSLAVGDSSSAARPSFAPPAAAGAVYRSLPGVSPVPAVRTHAPAGSFAPVKGAAGPDAFADAFAARVALTATATPAAGPASGNSVPMLPVPLSLFPLAPTSAWFDSEDGDEVVDLVRAALHAHVGALGGTVDLKRSTSKCKFECRASGQSLAERCDFDVHVFDARSEGARAPGRFLVEAQRTGGDPFLFRDVVHRTIKPAAIKLTAGAGAVAGDKLPSSAACAVPPARFVPPTLSDADLAAIFGPNGGDSCGACSAPSAASCACADAQVSALVDAAVTGAEEQRVQAVVALADSCVLVPGFRARLDRVQAARRMRALLTDRNPLVRVAAERVVQGVGA